MSDTSTAWVIRGSSYCKSCAEEHLVELDGHQLRQVVVDDDGGRFCCDDCGEDYNDVSISCECGSSHMLSDRPTQFPQPDIDGDYGTSEFCHNCKPHSMNVEEFDTYTFLGRVQDESGGDNYPMFTRKQTARFCSNVANEYVDVEQQMYLAGCKTFTFDQAMRHWGNPGHHNTERALQMVHKVVEHHRRHTPVDQTEYDQADLVVYRKRAAEALEAAKAVETTIVKTITLSPEECVELRHYCRERDMRDLMAKIPFGSHDHLTVDLTEAERLWLLQQFGPLPASGHNYAIYLKL